MASRAIVYSPGIMQIRGGYWSMPQKKLMGYIADHHDALLGMLTDDQKETLEKFDDCYAELTEINEREIFLYAFRLGMRIAIEVFTEPERQ